MKKYIYSIKIAVLALALSLSSSCLNDLDTVPLDQSIITSATYYTKADDYKAVLAKIYGGLSLTGQVGPDGDADVKGIDEGSSNYIRAYWWMQDMTTEMALWTWTGDPGVAELQTNNWSASNEVILGMYSRIFYQITLANEFIRESLDDKLSSKGFSAADQTNIKLFRAEARFMRAMSYYHALDMFGSVPFVTEADKVGAFLPKPISKQDLFNYIESELKDLETQLADPLTNQYGRVDKAAAWMVLAKLYLNAKVYTGQAKNTEAITYSKKVMNSAYVLDANYQSLFWADNYKSKEVILPVICDGLNAQSWGATTMIVRSSWIEDMNPTSFGISAWSGGNRARKQLTDKFPDFTGVTDKRAMFFTNERTPETTSVTEFKNGYSVMKYKNINTDGSLGSNPSHMDIDFPLLRKAEAYLIFAEAVLRGGTGGTNAEALEAVNVVRRRAFGGVSGNVASIDLDFILDERAREFYWEGYRRTDLVRYDKFTSEDYLWEWKGGVFEGKALDAKYNHFPLPASDVAANPNLSQDGY